MSISGEKGKKVHEFHFRLEIYLHYYFHATWALLEDFEIFDHFGHIFYLTFSHLSTPQSGYDPVGPTIRIANASIWPLLHSWVINNGVGKSFVLHKWGLKNEKFTIFRFSTINQTETFFIQLFLYDKNVHINTVSLIATIFHSDTF